MTKLNSGEMICALIKNPKLRAINSMQDVVGWKDGILVELTSLRDRSLVVWKNEEWELLEEELQ
jgi:hypothetical protein